MWAPPMRAKYGHSCFGKIRKIFERTGVLLTHDEVTFLCNLWECRDAEDFYRKMEGMSDDQLRDFARKAKKKKAGGLTDSELARLYA
jgi:hypothetical protein